ncbi:Uma2 family endonuclease [Endozoicomonas sp. ONNA1]|uniref:Uma2 family endonuclease n=1 Tax=Endozoicomonas sp. ONNA1 TaxID=2828740 RepID=UPI0021482F25|nr:Uma2 family endonuclease [Endozoicomonas sp. ONNA1]
MNDLAEEFYLMSEAEYLAFEETNEVRHEYCNGYVVVMSGGTANHEIICLNCAMFLRTHAPDGCQAFANNMKMRIKNQDRTCYRYPDAWLRCVDNKPSTETIDDSPRFIIEVLSPGTRTTDLTSKAEEYSLALKPCQGEYLVIDTQRPRITLLGWVNNVFKEKRIALLDETIQTTTFKTPIPVSELYRDIDWQ